MDDPHVLSNVIPEKVVARVGKVNAKGKVILVSVVLGGAVIGAATSRLKVEKK